MAERMSVQDALALAKKYENSGTKIGANDRQPTSQNYFVDISSAMRPIESMPPVAQPAAAQPSAQECVPTRKESRAEPCDASRDGQSCSGPCKNKNKPSKPAEKKTPGALAEFAAKLLAAQTALNKTQIKYDAAKADLDEKRADLLKATEDIQNSVMKSTGTSREPRQYVRLSDPGSFAHRTTEFFIKNANKVFSARDIGDALGEGSLPKIFTTLNDLARSEKIARVSRGRYQYCGAQKAEPF